MRVHIDTIGDVAILECERRIVRGDAAFTLRDAVLSQSSARIVVLDLSEVDAVEGVGLGMLVFLQRWASDHAVQFKLFNPSSSVRHRLHRANAMSEFEIASA